MTGIFRNRKHIFIDSVPAARVVRIINEIIEEETSIDVTAEWASANGVYQLVKNVIDIGGSADADELQHHNASTIRHLCEKALRMLGYRQAAQSTDRVRMPFDCTQRTRMCDVWVKDHQLFGGPKGIGKLRIHMGYVIERRRFRTEKKKDNVVQLADRQPYEAI